MRLAADEITITVGDETIHLRPTLRAAYRLERRYGGFDKIIRSIADGSLSVIADVIAESSNRVSSIPDFCRRLDSAPMQVSIDALSIAAFNVVLTMVGTNDREGDKRASSSGASRLTFTEYHQKLFGIATGWLGWPPETAWNATAAEILAAYEGRQDCIQQILKAIFGGGDDDDAPIGPAIHSEDEIAEGRAQLKAMVLSGGNRGA
jgi:hypothetical protein